ncbi:MAG: topoisomerase DNA-binding C4 zinc finger domain-containing protein [Candidatus Shapirobacteria bacterium]|nr:topoisomerase DNA-binding C4 zinc finger domain-containing protein [Candidatus Shapirobacteria bacterium]
MDQTNEKCPKCGAQLGEVIETATGRKLQRCSQGSWNAQTHKNEGCEYVKWLEVEPKELDEVCPKCGAPLVLQVTRFGKKMKKCSKGGWDKEAKKATGCDYIEWITGTTEALDEVCPKCGSNLVLYTTANGKKMKKCSTSGWDSAAKKATGCEYVLWLKADQTSSDNGEEYLPPEEP